MMIRERRFWALFGAQTLGAFADNTLRMAMIAACTAAALRGTGPFDLPYGLGDYAGTIVSIAFTIPVLTFSILAGQLADKFARSSMIRVLKVIEVILMIVAAAFFAFGNGVALIFTLFLMGTQSAFFSPVRNAVMPQYYAAHELVRVNGFFNAALFVAIVLGLGLGGHFVNQPGGRIVVSALLIGAAALGAVLAFFTPFAEGSGLRKIDWFLPAAIVRQFGRVGRLPGVLYPVLGIAWFWMIGAAVLANMPNYVVEALGGGDTEMSLLQAAFAIGAGIGSVVTGLIGQRLAEPLRLAALGVAGTVAGSVLIWVLTENGASVAAGVFTLANTPLLLALIGTAAANGMFAVPLMAALHHRAPADSRAQVMGVSNTTNGALATLGALAIIPLRQAGLSASDVFLALAAMQAALFAFMVYRSGAIRAAACKN